MQYYSRFYLDYWELILERLHNSCDDRALYSKAGHGISSLGHNLKLILELFSKNFDLLLRSFPWNSQRSSPNHGPPGKRLGNNESIPRTGSPNSGGRPSHRPDRSPRKLGQGHDALLDDARGSSWGIWSQSHVMAGLQSLEQAPHSHEAPPAGRTPYRRIAEVVQSSGQEFPIPALADKTVNVQISV